MTRLPPDPTALAGTKFVLCDLDDTLTLDGRMPAVAYAALERLTGTGIEVVVVTGRPAGWCDLIARIWPVAAVVGENGAFYFRHDAAAGRMQRVFQRSEEERQRDQQRLAAVFAGIQAHYPSLRLSADQPYRVSDYAVDFCEDVPPVGDGVVQDIVRRFEAAGATAKVSSIHVNAWFGDFTKLEMSLRLLGECHGIDAAAARERVVYVGDSPNDEPMFGYFPRSFGVANVARFLPTMPSHPAWITRSEGGYGFAEVADLVCRAR